VSAQPAELPRLHGVRRKVAHVMGMPISLALRGLHTDDEDAECAWQNALASLQETDRVFSTYRPDSAISRLQRGEIGLPDCPPSVREVLDLGERARRESDGAFDVRRRGPDGAVHLDPSGVVKGWAVDRAARSLDALPQTDFCLSAGGDMICHTKRPGAPAWRIGIEDPRDPGRVLAVVRVHNGAVATSGLTHRGAHIVDARTGEVPHGTSSVTVVSQDLLWADIDATASFALGRDTALHWLRGRPGRSGLLVPEDGAPEPFRGPPA
jgi:thiamine biosynthesis lipoprotein